MSDKIEPIFKNGEVPESLCLEHDYIKQPIQTVFVYPYRHEIKYACKYCKSVADWSEDKVKIDMYMERRNNDRIDL